MDNLIFLVKEASDADEALDLAAEYADAGYLDEDDIDKLASAYEDGSLDAYYAQQDAANFMLDKIASDDELEKIALFRKKTLRQRAGKKMREVGKSVSKKWKKLSPTAKRAIKGSGAAAALGGAGAAGYFLGRRD